MQEIIIAIIGSGAFTAVVSVVATSIVNYRTRKKESDELIKDSVKSLLGIQIRNQCEKAIERKCISIEELQQIQEMNNNYMKIGGNGFVKTLMKKVEALPIIVEGD